MSVGIKEKLDQNHELVTFPLPHLPATHIPEPLSRTPILVSKFDMTKTYIHPIENIHTYNIHRKYCTLYKHPKSKSIVLPHRTGPTVYTHQWATAAAAKFLFRKIVFTIPQKSPPAPVSLCDEPLPSFSSGNGQRAMNDGNRAWKGLSCGRANLDSDSDWMAL